MPDLTTSETLNLAADYLQQHGWMQGDAGDHGGPRCLMGAIHSAVYDRDDASSGRLYGSARMAVINHLGLSGIGYNDTPGRTQAEVIAVLRATAVVESAREVRTTLAGLPGSPA